MAVGIPSQSIFLHPKMSFASNKPPPPLDDPSVSDPLDCPPLRWGMISCGRVCHDFCLALRHVPSAQVVACSARDLARAHEFASKHAIPKAYGSYEELVQDEDVEIVYVGNVHSFRKETVEMCLRANKHVLVEKPFACTLADAEYLMSFAKERNLFIMEGMWTRFFPAVEQARRLALQEGVLGHVVSVFSDFNFNANDSEIYPTSFFYNRKLGGGATLLTGPYPITVATLFFKGADPSAVKVTGQYDEQTGVDLQAAVVLAFSPKEDDTTSANESYDAPKLEGRGVACLSYGMLGESEETTVVVGTKGRLTIGTPSHCPTQIKVCLKAEGRGQAAKEEIYNYELPLNTPEIDAAGGYFYPNSAGFCYEAAAVARCIAANKTEPPQYTHAETLVGMKILEQARLQLGVKDVYEA